jgi:hypothetical protein
VHALNVISWPGAEGPPEDIAAKMLLSLIRGQRKLEPGITATSIGSPALAALLRFVKGNMAAVHALGEQLKSSAQKLEMIDSGRATTLFEHVLHKLLSRNSNRGRKWDESPLKEIAQKMFDAAVLGTIPSQKADDLSMYGLLTFESSSEAGMVEVSVNGFYWHHLCTVVGQWLPSDPFNPSPDDFEQLPLEWIRCRAVAYRRYLAATRVRACDLLPGCQQTMEVQLRNFDAACKVVRSSDKIEEGAAPTSLKVAGLAAAIPVKLPFFFVNGKMAQFADGVAMLPNLLVETQSKMSTNVTSLNGGSVGPIRETDVRDEMAKAGFSSTAHNIFAFGNQRTLSESLRKKCGATAARVFLLFTHKPVQISTLPDDCVVISAANFEKLGPFAMCACVLEPHASLKQGRSPSTGAVKQKNKASHSQKEVKKSVNAVAKKKAATRASPKKGSTKKQAQKKKKKQK